MYDDKPVTTQTGRKVGAIAAAVHELRERDQGTGQYRLKGDAPPRIVYDWPGQDPAPVCKVCDETIVPHPAGLTRQPTALGILSRRLELPVQCPYCEGDGWLVERPVSARRGCEPSSREVPCDTCDGAGIIEHLMEA